MINSLVGVLCRFRKEAVAFICDIERMFHQFFVRPENCSYLRFLWWEHGDLDCEPKEYQMAVHLFGAASSPGCANCGLKYLAQQYKSLCPSAAAFVKNSFYVDDGLVSIPSIKEVSELIVEAQKLCKGEVYGSTNSVQMREKFSVAWIHLKEQQVLGVLISIRIQLL